MHSFTYRPPGNESSPRHQSRSAPGRMFLQSNEASRCRSLEDLFVVIMPFCVLPCYTDCPLTSLDGLLDTQSAQLVAVDSSLVEKLRGNLFSVSALHLGLHRVLRLIPPSLYNFCERWSHAVPAHASGLPPSLSRRV